MVRDTFFRTDAWSARNTNDTRDALLTMDLLRVVRHHSTLLCISVAQSTGVIRGSVMDDAQKPVTGAIVEANGVTAISDSLGRFYLNGVPASRQAIVVRKLGFAPETVAVNFTSNGTVELTVRLTAVPVSLSRVEVSAERPVPAKLAGFEARRSSGIGRFLTQADIEKAPGIRMSEKIRQLPGVRLIYSRSNASSVFVATTRGQSGLRNAPCLARVILDGLMLGSDYSINQIQPGEIAALEWYSGPSQVPQQFNMTGNACGLLVIWTK